MLAHGASPTFTLPARLVALMLALLLLPVLQTPLPAQRSAPPLSAPQAQPHTPLGPPAEPARPPTSPGPRVAPPAAAFDPAKGLLTLTGGDARDTLHLALEGPGPRLVAVGPRARLTKPVPAFTPTALRAVHMDGAAALLIGGRPAAALSIDSGGAVTLADPLALSGALRVKAASLAVRAPIRAPTIDLQVAGVLDLAAGSSLTATSGPAAIVTDALIATGDIGAPSITIDARTIVQAGRLAAPAITVRFRESYHASAASRLSVAGPVGGHILLDGGPHASLFTSGTLDATGTVGAGGTIDLFAHTIALAAATADASGVAAGGRIRIGGDLQGHNPALLNATTMTITGALRADALGRGDGGTIIVWADETTAVAGIVSARGGPAGGDGGFVELSGKVTLQAAAAPDVGAPAGSPGQALLDPRNLTVATTGALPQFDLLNPSPGAGDTFGNVVVTLPGGNIVVVDSGDDAVAPDAGAVYLFNGLTGALISTLSGTTPGDALGGGVTPLTNGNVVVASPFWGGGAGAATWLSGASGLSGSVGAANSLVGSAPDDNVGSPGVTALPGGDYVVRSTFWNNGAASNAGAVTWGSGSGGTTGAVSAANSLVGTSANDLVGSGGVSVLANGSYVVASPSWDNGVASNAGAVTWRSAAGGTVGAVSAANSLVGTTAADSVGSGGVTALAIDNYVVASPSWDNGATVNAGAATWGNGAAGTAGAVSAANSLVGTAADDQVGAFGVSALANGSYVVRSPFWDDGATADAGAATWGNGSGGTSGAVSAANSLVGSSDGDLVANALVAALPNGNYVVGSTAWDNGATADVGAATWGSGAGGTVGAVTAANSLVGASAGDQVSVNGIATLTSGNYVVRSALWDNGPLADAGAVTWASGSGGTAGAVSAANSLVGSAAGDRIGGGLGAVTALPNGNYVIRSPLWDDGAAANAGAVTWGDGFSGTAGPVGAANSLVGSTADDLVGTGVAALPNGDYVVRSSFWDDGAVADVGAVTWGNGFGGTTGAVSAANSLVGSAAFDTLGSGGVTALSSGDYVVLSPSWDDGALTDVGAATWGSGAGGAAGAVSAANSLIGATAFDSVGSGGLIELASGDYVVGSPSWDSGSIADAGAASLGYADGSTVGPVGAASSIVGTAAGLTLVSPRDDGANSTFVASFAGAGGRVAIGFGEASQLTYPRAEAASLTVRPDLLTRTLNPGAALTLQASNDLTFIDPVIANNSRGSAGPLTLQAGRTVALNSALVTDGGELIVIGNDTLAGGVVDAQRDPGDATITMGAGSSVNAGAGAARFELRDGAGKTNAGRATITLTSVTAATTQVAGAPLTPGGAGAVGTTSIVGDLALEAGSGLTVDITGPTAGQYDLVSVAGAVSLGGPFSFAPSGYTPGGGQLLTIIANDGADPVVGAFSNLAEGDFLTVGGVNLRISYVGGTGNDVTLTPVGPTPVTLVAFTAAPLAGGVELRWETASEQDVAGYHLLRSLDGRREGAVRLTAALIPAEGDGVVGAAYRWADTWAPTSATPSYWLEVIGRDGSVEQHFGPVSPAPRLSEQTSVYLPLVGR